ncbi:MAG: hypothetical protein Q8R02_15865 [Hyphomonadaceae bacterium]|nr:hypothetical protein [Hyphomonadaceae bacterium]
MRVRWIIGVICAGLVLVFLVVISGGADIQRLAVTNAFEDADCRIEFSDGSVERFKVRKDGTWTRNFQAPKPGFATMRCRTVSKLLESPASFHLRDGQLATLTISPHGVAELTYSPMSK